MRKAYELIRLYTLMLMEAYHESVIDRASTGLMGEGSEILRRDHKLLNCVEQD